MFLSALLLTAALQAAPPIVIAPSRPSYAAMHEHAIVQAIMAKAACRTPGVERIDQGAFSGQAQPRRLGDLPPANHTLTVLRSIHGCPVSSTVRFNVDRPPAR